MKIKLITLAICACLTTGIKAQIEELDPTQTEIDVSSNNSNVSDPDYIPSEEEYRDTWKTPYVEDDMTIDSEQNKSWKLGEYQYSSQPKNSWEIGLHGGHFFFDGDVDTDMPGGFGVGGHIRKALNYVFSIRASAFYGVASGLENQFWRHRNNTDANGIGGGLVEDVFNPIDPREGGPGTWFPSYRTTYISGDLAVVLNIGNLLFHKERNKWNWYAAFGIGLDHHNTDLDLLGSDNNPYFGVIESVGWTPELFNTRAGREQIEGDLRDIYDGVYETDAFQKAGIFRIGDDINIHPIFVPSMGIARKITKRINIGLEHQLFLSDNDYLDGIQSRTSVDQTNNLDIGHYTHIRIGFNIGNFDNVTEPLYWLNPYDAAFSDIANLKSQPKLDLTDEDNDGVIDMMDQELDTPEDCPVDTRGVRLDSDGDGIVDCEDKEPYSRPGCPIDEVGVAQCEDACCTDEDEVARLIDQRTEEMRETFDAFGGTVPTGGGTRTVTKTVTGEDGVERTVEVEVPVAAGGGRHANSGCGEWFLPMIHFDLNKHTIKPEYFSSLHNIAQVLTKCPNLCVTAQGHTDSRNSNDYNRVLSYKRAKESVDYLVDNYGIDRSRVKLMFGGEDNPMITAPNTEAHHFMNRRVEFRTCEDTDFDMGAPDGYIDVQSSGASQQSEYYNGNKSTGY